MRKNKKGISLLMVFFLISFVTTIIMSTFVVVTKYNVNVVKKEVDLRNMVNVGYDDFGIGSFFDEDRK